MKEISVSNDNLNSKTNINSNIIRNNSYITNNSSIINMNYFISSRNRPLLVKSLVIVIFYVIFFLRYAVITKMFFSN